ncbi:MAG TPA: chemotaxis response regulator protein-glutamate methylesterase [Kineosporiaceae bacterium]|nr:chemotaxis response regulator protein-glutamate methylesterase [Kineosporiaceae bacterium]
MTGTTPGRPGCIRVLVVDDSLVIRRLVVDALGSDPDIEVVGQAPNGKVALEKVAALKPDAVTMDIEMPEMNGIEAVRALRRTHPRLPVVMFSTLTERGAAATLDALAAGASDYVTKPSNVGSFADSQRNVREQLILKLKALTASRRASGAAAPVTPPPRPAAPRRPRAGAFGVLAIGCSTGGPDALATLLPALPADLPVPVVVVQHMPPVFTRLLANRLDGQSRLTVTEAQHGDAVVPGRVLIAPGGFHLVVRRSGPAVVAELTEDPPENFCRPAVDVLFRSVAAVYGDRTLAAVLTGMGRDGERGAKAVHDAGGEVYVQDDATSVVWGMPGAVAGAGLADKILPLPQIGPALATALTRSAATAGAGAAT